jgi:hypothetical protein
VFVLCALASKGFGAPNVGFFVYQIQIPGVFEIGFE